MIRALQHRDFRLLFSGQVVSAIGDQIFPIAVTVQVLDNGCSAGDLGLVLAARFASLVLFALIGGVWADGLPRVRVLLCLPVRGVFEFRTPKAEPSTASGSD